MNLLKLILRPLKIVAIIVVVFVILVVGAVGLLNTSSVQDKFLSYATDMLQEKLQTKVSIDSIRIGFFSDDVRLYNLQVEDLQHRPMLKLERFAV
jgi:autotransporter translocation and assembly factor TamB